ncbi:MAG: TIGR03086 family metal-binding protein [Microbacteriaceae bacterium]
MHPIEQLDIILPALCDLVDRVDPVQLAAPTPCDEFDVHDVLDHIIVLGGSFASLFRGERPQSLLAPPVYGRVPAPELRAVLEDLRHAVHSDGAMQRMLDTPVGQLDGETFARMVALDGVVHGWDIGAATGQRFVTDVAVVDAVDTFARQALSPEIRATGMFEAPTEPPADASPLEALVAYSGRSVAPRWRTVPSSIRIDKNALPVKIDAPGAIARQLAGFGDATGYGVMAGEYFTLGAGTDIAPLLRGLEDDACHAPHWGYMISGELIASFVDGEETTCRGGELFYWAPGHSVRVVNDSEVILFSPAAPHTMVLDHMQDVLQTA